MGGSLSTLAREGKSAKNQQKMSPTMDDESDNTNNTNQQHKTILDNGDGGIDAAFTFSSLEHIIIFLVQQTLYI